MKKTSHLIIGANSFLGVAISKALLKQNSSVIGVFHKNKNNLNTDIKNIPISSLEKLEDNFDVVHIISAFVSHDSASQVLKKMLFEVNVSLVKRICDKFCRAKIIYSSTVSVYENNNYLITESSTVQPVSEYAKSKLLGESIVKQHDKYAILRISSMYGSHMKLTTFLPAIIKKALDKKTITLFGNGLRLQNYIHVDDVAQYFVAASTYDKNDTFLVTYSESFSNKTIAGQVAAALKDITIEFVGVDNSNSYLYNNEFTNKTLGINCSINLNKGINQLIAWMKKEF